jgi:hypothetical protein
MSELFPCNFLNLIFKTFINHVRGPEKSVWQAASSMQAIVCRALG